MKRTICWPLVLGLALLIAGCAPGGGYTGSPTATRQAATAGSNTDAAATGPARDFNLRVKCPGIHLEKTNFKWSDRQIMTHENVTLEQIGQCEVWSATQPKGYVPTAPVGPGGKGSAGDGTTGHQAESAGPAMQVAH
jgi:hypothetical protein